MKWQTTSTSNVRVENLVGKETKVFSVNDDIFVIASESKQFFVGRATAGSIGFDVKAKSYIIDWSRDSIIYFTGIRALVKGMRYYIEIVPRSSVYKRKHLGCVPNSIGVIDKDYTGEILIVFRLKFRSWFERMWYRLGLGRLDIYYPGERVAQLIIRPAYSAEVHTEPLSEIKEYVKAVYGDKRLDNGFGSTGK